MKEACGILGIINSKNAYANCATGLFALQHRGEEACGISGIIDGKLINKSGIGLINRVFEKEDFKAYKNCHSAIAHARYSVTGASQDSKNIQPLSVQSLKGNYAIAHNGNLVNSLELRRSLEHEGAIFQSSTDTEIIIHLVARSKKPFKDALAEACSKVRGAYCLLVITNEGIYAIRDPDGFKPLCYGTLPKKEGLFDGESQSYVIASETPALDLLGAKYEAIVEPGEMIFFSNSGKIEKSRFSPKRAEKDEHKCIFELIYFSRPDSYLFNESTYRFRKKLGEILADDAPCDADIVVPIPDSGMFAALGYANKSKIPFEFGITKNHYTGRSFIQPSQTKRDLMVKLKLNPIKSIVKDKKVVLVDDSIVRGTTTKRKIEAFWNAGAKEVHMRVAAPPINNPCFYGIDFPKKSELIANKMKLDEIKNYLQVSSLAYLSVDGLRKASKNAGFCLACFDGNYPVKIEGQMKEKMQKEILLHSKP